MLGEHWLGWAGVLCSAVEGCGAVWCGAMLCWVHTSEEIFFSLTPKVHTQKPFGCLILF